MPSEFANNNRQIRVSKKPPDNRSTFMPERLLDSDEAASSRKCHPKTLQKLIRKGVVSGV